MFSKEDVLLARGLKKVLEDGTFPLRVKEVQAFATIYKWVATLEEKIENSIEKPKKKVKK